MWKAEAKPSRLRNAPASHRRHRPPAFYLTLPGVYAMLEVRFPGKKFLCASFRREAVSRYSGFRAQRAECIYALSEPLREK